jgi:hypothetical protein
MAACAVTLGVAGAILIFAPEWALLNLGIDSSPTSLLLAQVTGGLYFGYGIVNWMAKHNLIGGIYNRPLALGNFTHFFIVGLSVVKALISNRELPKTIWVAGAMYIIFGLLFLVILFRHPVKAAD